jgi:hypothetical protein
MYSGKRNRCSQRLGFPIRKSPDHRLLASSRGLSQLTTSFFACLRQGIHTHALSSLTIKSTSNTKCFDVSSLALALLPHPTFFSEDQRFRRAAITCDKLLPVKYSIVKDQTSCRSRLFSRFLQTPKIIFRIRTAPVSGKSPSASLVS